MGKTKNPAVFPARFLTLIAERTRFELVVRYNPYAGLANRWFQPLTHLSNPSQTGRQSYNKNLVLQHYSAAFPVRIMKILLLTSLFSCVPENSRERGP